MDLEGYKKLKEPDKRKKAENWRIAIGLQQVDGLTPSKYLIETAKENIEGKISIKEVKKRIDTYYKTHEGVSLGPGKKEADKVSAHISELLADQSFTFAPTSLCAIHDKLFYDVFPDIAGKIRKHNITKKEPVLNGDTVRYGTAEIIMKTLEYDFDREKMFDYQGLSKREKVEHIAKFMSGIWQIHPFAEGNTRTIAVFAIKYLRAMGFDANNELFEQNSKYFRNALVRANYQNLEKDITYTMEYLNRFFGNLLLGQNNKLDNADLFTDKTTQKTTQKTPRKRPENAQKILDALADNPASSRQELAKTLGMTEDRVKWNLNKLRKEGKIKRVGPDKGGYWEISIFTP